MLKEQLNIEAWLEKSGIKNYELIPSEEHGFMVDVRGSVDLRLQALDSIGVKFRDISRNFYCNHNKLTSLMGCPDTVGGNFYCSYNLLTSLKGAPSTVGGDFYCTNNHLVSLSGSPREINCSFYCNSNYLTCLTGGPEKIGQNFVCNHNALTSLEGCPKSVGRQFSFIHNPGLHEYDGLKDFQAVYQTHLISEEKRILNQNIQQNSGVLENKKNYKI